MGIRASISRDGVETWDVTNEVIIHRDGFGPPCDLDYPVSFERADGRILTAYYFTSLDRPTHIVATIWELD